MTALTKSMCWKMIKKTSDTINQVGLAIYRKPSDNKCYEQRTEDNPPLCQASDDPDAAWYALCFVRWTGGTYWHVLFIKIMCVFSLLTSFSIQEYHIPSVHAQVACRFN